MPNNMYTDQKNLLQLGNCMTTRKSTHVHSHDHFMNAYKRALSRCQSIICQSLRNSAKDKREHIIAMHQ